MRHLSTPAGASLKFTATARPGLANHRWRIAVVAAADGAPRLSFASQIGGADIDQRITFPIQDVDCDLHIQAQHETSDGWADDAWSTVEDTPDLFLVGFHDPDSRDSRLDDVLLSFALVRPTVASTGDERPAGATSRPHREPST